ncbi:MAG: hypothetical protein ACM37Z_12070 [Deltaproteobacteria bacterium]
MEKTRNEKGDLQISEGLSYEKYSTVASLRWPTPQSAEETAEKLQNNWPN